MTAATASIIVDQFEGRVMWPMTDAEAVLFIMTVALLVALEWPSPKTESLAYQNKSVTFDS